MPAKIHAQSTQSYRQLKEQKKNLNSCTISLWCSSRKKYSLLHYQPPIFWFKKIFSLQNYRPDIKFSGVNELTYRGTIFKSACEAACEPPLNPSFLSSTVIFTEWGIRTQTAWLGNIQKCKNHVRTCQIFMQ